MNKFFTFILSLVLFGCSSINMSINQSNLSEKERVADEILANTAARLKKEKELNPFGSGGRMMDEVKMLMLAFTYNKPIELEEGRELIVYAVETFVSMINNDERIHPYLYNYPFEPKNVKVEIYIKNPNCSSIEPEKLCVLIAREGVIKYEVQDFTTSRLKTIYEESFIQAQKKVKESSGV
jgi:hypothetical protein